MKSRISLCNRTAFWKAVTRFFPVWVLYTVSLLLGLVLLSSSIGTRGDAWAAQEFGSFLQGFAVINCIYALICAQVLFGDLYTPRMCNALHSLPLRRETWFFTHVLAGCSFFLLPNILLCLLVLPLLGSYWFTAGYVLVGLTLSWIFFFGTALLSVFCAGSRFAMALVYGILQLLAALLGWVIMTLYDPLLYGVDLPVDFLSRFSPLVQIASTEHITALKDPLGNLYVEIQGFGYLALCALAGLAFGYLALVLYRRRQLESAGDFIVVKPLAPAFLLLYSLAAGTVLQSFFELFMGITTGVFYVGIIVGFLTGQMLLLRKPNIFSRRVLLELAVFVGIMGLSLGLTRLDPLGVTRYVPQLQEVETAELSQFSGYYGESYAVTDPEEIGEILEMHRAAIMDGEVREGRRTTIQLTYRLRSGKTVQREYVIAPDSRAAALLAPIFSQPEVLFHKDLDSAQAYADYLGVIRLYAGTDIKIFQPQLTELLEAVLADCAEGTMTQEWIFHPDSKEHSYLSFDLPYADGGAYKSREIIIFPDCRHTCRWLEEHGYPSPQAMITPEI